MASRSPLRIDPGFGVYVHWPFCLSKCPYCDFNSHVRRNPVDEGRFIEAFKVELAHRAKLTRGRTVGSVFFGGGTPSLMKPQTVAAILQAIADSWTIEKGAEITLEANPSSVEAERFRGYRSVGVNRVSLGVQALDDSDLRMLGRLHNREDALAALDVATSLARLAVDENYVRPEVDTSLGFAIEGGRHPVVEQALKRDGQPFIANACDLSPGPAQASGQIWLITGPNMAGKSTFLRQNALIALMAQIGSFVPASRARIGIIDRLFSRVGAADDLARGRSTFMVEMVETAAILNQAGERALVILDEIGRGTATFDGLSIAWASIEHLHEANRCRALFATHYHELTALSAKLPRLFNATVRVKEWHGDVVFLHEVLPGSADRSYGIQVAKLAGLPASVVTRAKAVLAKLEAQDRNSTTRALADDLPLFAVPARAAAEPSPPSEADRLMEALRALHPDDLSPREALEALYALKARLPKE